MKKLLILSLSLSATAYAGNIPDRFDNRPVLPAVQNLRTFDWTWQNVAKIPNISARAADHNHKGRFMQSLTINDENPKPPLPFMALKPPLMSPS